MHTPRLNVLNVDSLIKKLKAAQSVLLTTHKQCDGDGLGALLGLYHALKKTGKEVRALTVDAIPKKYHPIAPWSSAKPSENWMEIMKSRQTFQKLQSLVPATRQENRAHPI